MRACKFLASSDKYMGDANGNQSKWHEVIATSGTRRSSSSQRCLKMVAEEDGQLREDLQQQLCYAANQDA